jgi:hypothetical protein
MLLSVCELAWNIGWPKLGAVASYRAKQPGLKKVIQWFLGQEIWKWRRAKNIRSPSGPSRHLAVLRNSVAIGDSGL